MVVGAPVNLGALLEVRQDPGGGRRPGLAVRREPLGKARERGLWGARGT